VVICLICGFISLVQGHNPRERGDGIYLIFLKREELLFPVQISSVLPSHRESRKDRIGSEEEGEEKYKTDRT